VTGGIPTSPATRGLFARTVGAGRVVEVLRGTEEESAATDDAAAVGVGVGDEVAGAREVADGRAELVGALLDPDPVEVLVHPAIRTVAVVSDSAVQILILHVTVTG
jgi:hypothetical protein